MVEHRGLCNYLYWAREYYKPEGSIVSSPLSFDATVTSLYAPILHGGRTRLLPERGEVDVLNQKIIQVHSCGLVKITPGDLEALGNRSLAKSQTCWALCHRP